MNPGQDAPCPPFQENRSKGGTQRPLSQAETPHGFLTNGIIYDFIRCRGIGGTQRYESEGGLVLWTDEKESAVLVEVISQHGVGSQGGETGQMRNDLRILVEKKSHIWITHPQDEGVQVCRGYIGAQKK